MIWWPDLYEQYPKSIWTTKKLEIVEEKTNLELSDNFSLKVFLEYFDKEISNVDWRTFGYQAPRMTKNWQEFIYIPANTELINSIWNILKALFKQDWGFDAFLDYLKELTDLDKVQKINSMISHFPHDELGLSMQNYEKILIIFNKKLGNIS